MEESEIAAIAVDGTNSLCKDEVTSKRNAEWEESRETSLKRLKIAPSDKDNSENRREKSWLSDSHDRTLENTLGDGQQLDPKATYSDSYSPLSPKWDTENDGEETTADNSANHRPDILWCLTAKQKGMDDRSFYKDTPWKGVKSGLPGVDGDSDGASAVMPAVLAYYVDVDVTDKTYKDGNTSLSWRSSPANFELGRDAVLWRRFWPCMRIYSRKLIEVIDLVLDYYPYRGRNDFIVCEVEDTFATIMYCYAELKSYFLTYMERSSIVNPQETDPKLDIGSCGDESIIEFLHPRLDFGKLNPKERPCDEETAYDLAVLLRLLAGMYKVRVVPILTSLLLEPEPTIVHASLWILMKPGTILFAHQAALGSGTAREDQKRKLNEGDDDWSAFVVSSWIYQTDRESQNPKPYLKVEMWNIRYTTSFKRKKQNAFIDNFEGAKRVRDLLVVPSWMQERFDQGALQKRLVERGRKYQLIIKEGAALRMYKHPSSAYEGPIILDPESYRQYAGDTLNTTATIMDGGGGRRFAGLLDFDTPERGINRRIDEAFLLLHRSLEGFALRSKTWKIFRIEGISDQIPKPSYKQVDRELVLFSDADKDFLRTVLPKGEHPLTVTSDFVDGKGEGKIFLLYGGPGTGKTLTVECVANDTCRPLLHLTAQDVGLGSMVESNLRQYFELASRWDAILLIDEADLFLEQRKEGDLERNSLSTVFLRTMEYYKGVLFLTTNRPGHIDDSFISRITCPIAYPNLSHETKGKIIRRFVNKYEETGSIVIDREAIKYMAAHCQELNGRQIRNVLQNSVSSAEVQLRYGGTSHVKQPPDADTSDSAVVYVTLRHVKDAVERQLEFQEYLKKLKGRDEVSRARNKHDYLAMPLDMT